MTWDGTIPCHPIDAARIVYIEVPKAGCTSVKAALSILRGGPPEVGEDVHRWLGYTHALDHAELDRWLAGRWRGWFAFTVVRHPLRRFESYVSAIRPRRDVDAEAAEFVRRQDHDIHVVAQTAITGRLERYSFVGRTEAMADVAAALSAVSGQALAIPHLNVAQPPRPSLSARSVALLADAYRRDFEALGYVP